MRSLFQHPRGGRSNVHFIIPETGPQPFRDTLLELLAETFLPDTKLRLTVDTFTQQVCFGVTVKKCLKSRIRNRRIRVHLLIDLDPDWHPTFSRMWFLVMCSMVMPAALANSAARSRTRSRSGSANRG